MSLLEILTYDKVPYLLIEKGTYDNVCHINYKKAINLNTYFQIMALGSVL